MVSIASPLVVPIALAKGVEYPAGAPIALDARCVRLALRWPATRPLCCARGAPVDVRAKIDLLRHGVTVRWSDEVPALDDRAPSGVFERLADVRLADVTGPDGSAEVACAALDTTTAGAAGGLFGDGCSLRHAAIARGLGEDVWLSDACALFPLDIAEDTLVPSARIPDEALVEWAEGQPSLWDHGRARTANRWGSALALAIDDAAHELRAHHSRGVHLRTIR